VLADQPSAARQKIVKKILMPQKLKIKEREVEQLMALLEKKADATVQRLEEETKSEPSPSMQPSCLCRAMPCSHGALQPLH
jgi:hypothetical protein